MNSSTLTATASLILCLSFISELFSQAISDSTPNDVEAHMREMAIASIVIDTSEGIFQKAAESAKENIDASKVEGATYENYFSSKNSFYLYLALSDTPYGISKDEYLDDPAKAWGKLEGYPKVAAFFADKSMPEDPLELKDPEELEVLAKALYKDNADWTVKLHQSAKSMVSSALFHTELEESFQKAIAIELLRRSNEWLDSDTGVGRAESGKEPSYTDFTGPEVDREQAEVERFRQEVQTEFERMEANTNEQKDKNHGVQKEAADHAEEKKKSEKDRHNNTNESEAENRRRL